MKSVASCCGADSVSSAKRKSNPILTCTKSGATSTKAGKQRHKAAGNDMPTNTQTFSSLIQMSDPDIQVTGGTLQKAACGLPLLEGQHPQSSRKLKLQLFPINDFTRRGLEECKYNPYLELTLGIQKKISSVVKHLNTKWGNSKAAYGELMLFPYDAKIENLSSYQRWTFKDSGTTAADVYDALGNPAVFRLRYGWFSNFYQELCGVPLVSSESWKQNSCHASIQETAYQETKSSHLREEPGSDFENQSALAADVPDTPFQIEEKDLRIKNSGASLVLPDGLSNLSFPALLDEKSQLPNTSSLQQFPSTCDSFDAAIAHIACYQGTNPRPSAQVPQPSIWDAEETCDAFPFRKMQRKLASSSPQNDVPQFMRIHELASEVGQVKDSAPERTAVVNDVAHLNKSQEDISGPSEASLNGCSDLANIDFSLSESMGAWLNGLSSSRQMLGGDICTHIPG